MFGRIAEHFFKENPRKSLRNLSEKFSKELSEKLPSEKVIIVKVSKNLADEILKAIFIAIVEDVPKETAAENSLFIAEEILKKLSK